jgi:methyl-accepting chemotaxis protein
VNPAGAALLEKTPEQVMGMKCYNLLKTPHCQTPECRCQQAMTKGGVFTGETTAQPNGTALAIRYAGAPIKDASGNITGALEYVVDVTETRKALDVAEQRDGYLNSIPAPVMVVDRAMNVQFINTAGASALGKTPEQCLGKQCSSLFNTTHCNTSECRVARAMKEDGVFTGDTTARLPQGELPIRYTAAPIKDSSGNIVGALEYVMDIAAEADLSSAILSIREAVNNGHLEERGDTAKYDGNYQAIVLYVNELCDAFSKPISVTASSVRELSSAIDQLAAGSQDQAKSVQQASGAVNQLSAASEQVAANAQSATDGARQAAEAAEGGAQTVSDTIAGMDKIMNSMLVASEKVGLLGDNSKEIGRIVATIDDIAAQTNLLALNAAIEAARAGEQGRGFAVVADEVRKLAERSSMATKEIATLVTGIQTGVEEAIAAMEEGNVHVGEGNELAASAGDALQSILQAATGVAEQIEQISAASEELQAASAEMVSVIDSVGAAVEQNTASTEEMAASSAEVLTTLEKFKC